MSSRRLHGFEFLIRWVARDPGIRRFSVGLAFEQDGEDWMPMYRVCIWSKVTPKITWVATSAILHLAAESAIGRSGMKD